ncbi:hypothetical protein SAMN06295905_0378 [Devosia lucknowensis]|uniref:LPS-assembly lipoprotein n=1 Tax=Devosia lucknowensis TaxID=1096929 RepID=A0A1Y6EH21_9HYPH|nr:hypothetical protein [Devosia lucknowensis]SMQ60451.1 hypothetical protein SAMN06295905_0378 [Devosia lucknowensis]
MNRRTLLSGFGVAALAAVLSSCTSFAPVYGDLSSNSISAARFNFASPGSRLDQVALNRLKVAFPGAAQPSDPDLAVSIAVTTLAAPLSTSIAVAAPVRIRVEGRVTISRGDDVAFEATRFVDTSYQSGKLTQTEMASSSGAQEAAAIAVADALRAAILAGYRPGMPAAGN